ncbi:hypothetical protein F183_A28840 [Bryobacterales bacterium F-183]|nr:hypothetical protein F183_A28840 [Bryobacterales bacterium F-183]
MILLLARMEDRKGHRYLVEALSRVQHLEWECWIVGGPQRPSEFAYLRALRTRVDGLGLNGRVRFLGERTDVGDLLHASDILCHPHITPEPFGIAIVEAMSSGLIVVASNIGGPREVLTKESGLLVCPADAAGLASAIENVLDLPEEQRSRMAKAARERASELCAPTTAVTQLNDVLRLRRSLTAVPHQKVQPFWACLAKDLLAHIPVQRRRDGRRSRTVQYLRTVALSAGFHLTLLYRAAHALRDHFGAFGRALAFLLYWVTRHWYGCTISPKARLGGGLILPHPQGIVIGPDVTVGDRAWIYQNVTLGGGNHSGMPTIGDDARIYTGAVVAGGVRLGDRVSIGANSVVTFDVPDGARVRQPEPVMRLDRTHE